MEIIKDLSRLDIPVSAGEWFAAVGKCPDSPDGWWCFRTDGFRWLGSGQATWTTCAHCSGALALPTQ